MITGTEVDIRKETKKKLFLVLGYFLLGDAFLLYDGIHEKGLTFLTQENPEHNAHALDCNRFSSLSALCTEY